MWAHREGGDPPEREVKVERGVGDDLERAIRCARCGAIVTDENARMVVGGAHGHCFANPAGYVFEIGCFSAAPGCVVRGEPTREHSWFRGFAWSYAHCSGCDGHLGWCYQGGVAERFFGLILDRLHQDGN